MHVTLSLPPIYRHPEFAAPSTVILSLPPIYRHPEFAAKQSSGSGWRGVADAGIQRISERGMEAGKFLANRQADWSMCREIKLKRLGLRIVFGQSNRGIDIIDIVAVGKRSDSEVFATAAGRLARP